MDRRRFLLASMASVLSLPRVAGAQQRVPTIGALASTTFTETTRRAIRDGLSEHGYAEGRNIAIEWRSAEGRQDRAAALAAELTHLKVDVIVAHLSEAVEAAKKATSTIPIVMAPAGDPVAGGLVASLSRPGGNVTGVTGIGAALSGKQVEALRQVNPRLTRLALLINNVIAGSFSKELTAQTQVAAKANGITLHVVSAPTAEEIDRAFATIAAYQDEGVIVQGPVFTTSFGRIAQLGLRHHLPMIAAPKEFAETGGLLAYGASQTELTRRAMSYVARILRGAKPGDLPIEQPTRFELVVNLKTAKALGLTMPPSLLARADQIIE